MGTLKKVFWLAFRDLLLEFRGRTGVMSVLFFLVSMLMILGFALGPEKVDLQKAAPGVLWVALAFAGSLLGNRTFGLEVENETLDSLLMTKGSKEWIFFGKLLFQLILLWAIGAILIFLVSGLFYLPLANWPGYLLTIGLGTMGLAAISTFYAGLLARLQGRETLLPLLMLPLVVPIVVASVKAMTGLALGNQLDVISDWWKLLGVFDAVYISLCAILFPYVLNAD